MNGEQVPEPGSIAFGLDRATDERSLQQFVERFARQDLLATLVPRLSDQEIHDLLDRLSDLMRKHLRDKEYHRLFLAD